MKGRSKFTLTIVAVIIMTVIALMQRLRELRNSFNLKPKAPVVEPGLSRLAETFSL